MSCGVGCRCRSDPTLLWLWCRLAATGLIGPLAWEPPYASRAALKKGGGRYLCQVQISYSTWVKSTNFGVKAFGPNPSSVTLDKFLNLSVLVSSSVK